MAKVLLVEDDNNLREIYQARLAAEGYEISSAQDGEEALVVAKQEKPDLVISDVMMPKISGFEMLDILRNTAGLEHVKVIMLTALGQSEDRDRADSLGADKYLVKSQVTLEDIVKTAHTLLDGDTAAPAAAATTAPAVTPTVTDTPVATPPADPVATPPAVDDAAATPEPVTPPAEPVQSAPEPSPAPTLEDGAAQEQSVVQDQINTFVESTPAEAPVEAVETPAETPAEPPVETPAVAAEPASSGDDQLMAAAANELASSSEAGVAAAETPAEPPVETPAVSDNPDISTTTISGKKVIKPLDSEPKPDIHDLLAKEQASETGSTGPVVTSAPTATPAETPEPQATPGESVAPAPSEPSTPPAEKKPEGGLDPNSIAL